MSQTNATTIAKIVHWLATTAKIKKMIKMTIKEHNEKT
jgi:hypothetical protein